MTEQVQRIGGTALPWGNSSVQRQTCPSATVSIQLTDIRSNNDHTNLWNIRECSSYMLLRMVPLNYWANNKFFKEELRFRHDLVSLFATNISVCAPHNHSMECVYLTYTCSFQNTVPWIWSPGMLHCEVWYIHTYQYLRGIYLSQHKPQPRTFTTVRKLNYKIKCLLYFITQFKSAHLSVMIRVSDRAHMAEG